ncbi:similar to Saccharomyces cerevisiae YHR071W PCL5 Cyclin [Maudiozyma barnettii]|uniref:Similar to Saccharomyces cerevisiae YHR071W PCL5 Cyclin n=1 Tax=Maudiozyma barnettii TaxID=61262 RepID=A0A8H2ZGM1_9SACH|nr:Pcl5p [Kazachstania barnettii]CAB4253808.1 similar to Saccharomyces cerevisiae YHR071W PCL5 Cyclin [Kazachstania barnettii]CAD1781557.1 similar to Saccharomyces cerevisiae YHR071W PCL5 Cyclin [Kazachstania barnettii]
MQHISPFSEITNFEVANVKDESNEISETFEQSHLAYQTPPYETNIVNISSSSTKTAIHRFIASPQQCQKQSTSSKLIKNISNLMSNSTSQFLITDSKINNSFNKNIKFLTEVLKRSKSNKLIAMLASHYFKQIYENLNSNKINDLPEFAKCSKRIFLTCLILSHKFINDNTFSMKTWSSISGLPAKDLSTLERWCLHKLDYNLYVDIKEIAIMGKRTRDDDADYYYDTLRNKKMTKLNN